MTQLYDTIGEGYDSTRQADPYLAGRLFELLQPQEGKEYLDLGCGTGNYTAALAEKGLRLCGVDPSEKMLREAEARSKKVRWLRGTAAQLPLGDETFSGALATLTVHHWTDLERSFAEIFRVLKKQSRLVFFTADPGQIKGYWLAHYFPRMLHDSVVTMPAIETLCAAAGKAGFKVAAKEPYSVRDDLRDLFLYAGKNRPELYFDENVRKGISSFAVLANAAEVEEGLRRLRADIDSGALEQIKSRYENDLGDYLFLVFEK